jgi:hypothetical protein
MDSSHRLGDKLTDIFAYECAMKSPDEKWHPPYRLALCKAKPTGVEIEQA